MQFPTWVALDSPNTNSNAGGEKHIQKASFFIYHIETKSFTGNHMPCWWWSTRVSRVQFVFDVFGNPSVVTSIVYVFFTRVYTNLVDLNNGKHPNDNILISIKTWKLKSNRGNSFSWLVSFLLNTYIISHFFGHISLHKQRMSMKFIHIWGILLIFIFGFMWTHLFGRIKNTAKLGIDKILSIYEPRFSVNIQPHHTPSI